MNTEDIKKKILARKASIKPRIVKNPEVRTEKISDIIEEPEVKCDIEKLEYDGTKLFLRKYPNIEITLVMSEGSLFEKDGKKCQIPEITITFRRNTNGRPSSSPIERPVVKSVKSVAVNAKNQYTNEVLPNTFDLLVEHLETNFNTRMVPYFGFEIDFSMLKTMRFPTLFERAFSGQRLLNETIIV
jgi:hypothetical protein